MPRSIVQRLGAVTASAAIAVMAAAPAYAFKPSDPPFTDANPNAVGHCFGVIAFQTEAGIEAGGGPKVGIPGVTNCDHLFQDMGLIGPKP